MAVPSLVLKWTVTVRRVVPASVTVKLAPPPSFPDVSLIDRLGGAFLSTIVPAPSPSRTAAPTGPDSRTFIVSLSSVTPSPRTATVMFLAVSPGAKVNVPLPAV